MNETEILGEDSDWPSNTNTGTAKKFWIIIYCRLLNCQNMILLLFNYLLLLLLLLLVVVVVDVNINI